MQAKLLLLAVALLLSTVPTAQAVRSPAPGLNPLLSRMNQGIGWLERDAICVICVQVPDGRIGLFVGNNPINEVDHYGLWYLFYAPSWFDGQGYQGTAWQSFSETYIPFQRNWNNALIGLRDGNPDLVQQSFLGIANEAMLTALTAGIAERFPGYLGQFRNWFSKRCAAKATAPIEKFSNYIFKEGATHGKDAIFRGLGYGAEDSAQLAKMWQEQAAAKYAQGQYTLGKLDQYGQRINITIDVPGVGNAAGKSSSVTSGWMIRPDGSITLNTPFSGFPN
jgi:hypothetical protein